MSGLCAFSAADDSYAPKAAVSLLSIRKWNSTIPLFMLSRKFSKKTRKFLISLGITPIEINLDSTFTKTWDYPVECYYLFAGPEIFKKRGFSHSLYVDGDVYCNNDPAIGLKQVKAFAGVVNGSIKDILGQDFKTVSGNWMPRIIRKRRIQTGVIYFNNGFLHEFKFLHKIGGLSRQAINLGVPRKGDDSLFALFQYVYPELGYKELPRKYNFIEDPGRERVRKDWLTENESLINDSVFYHFADALPKPWADPSSFPNYTCQYFFNKWRHRAIDSLGKKELKRYFPVISGLLARKHLRFYWWPSQNVGDLVTPYFLSKVCKVKDVSKYSISEEGIGRIETGQNKSFTAKLKSKRTHGREASYCVSTGSVIRLCGEKALVFGSGIRSSNQPTKASFVRCVRGPLTRSSFLSDGHECPPVYGDPGLLMPRFYKPKDIKSNRLAIIPHFTEYEEVKSLYSDEKGVRVINMGGGNLEKVIDEIASCSASVSSSLHGLVFSHAYGVPSRRIIFSDRVYGDGTKYRDYYEGIGLRPAKPVEAREFKKIPVARLNKLAIEKLADLDDSRLFDSMFFNEKGFRKSASYPY